MASIILINVLVISLFFSVSIVQAVPATFVQTDWTVGQTSNTANHTSNQTGWAEYNVKDGNIVNSTELQLNNAKTQNINLSIESNYIQEDAVNGTDFSGEEVRLHSILVSAAGGAVTTVGDYRIHQFTLDDTFDVTSPGKIDFLVIGGGGGGGGGDDLHGGSGGGGAGGLVYKDNQNISNGSYVVTVGMGGARGIGGGDDGSSGENSIFYSSTALGGGRAVFGSAGDAGGSGGGGSRYGNVGGAGDQPSSVSGGYGNSGGAAYNDGTRDVGAGGGAGAGGVGAAGYSTYWGGNGGTGLDYSSIFGTGVGDNGWFASGGGGGGHDNRPGSASSGGGGDGGSYIGVAGMANTGGGGGGGSSLSGSSSAPGGEGGSGVVIVRYSTIVSYPTTSYYITTNDVSQLNTSTWQGLDDINISQTTPVNTNIKYLVSFDDRATWKYWNGSAWAASDMSDIEINGMTKTSIEAITDVQWSATDGFNAGTLDFASSLSTTDATVTPSLDNIEVNYLIDSEQSLVSNIYNTETLLNKINSISWNETLPLNTDIKFQVRTSSDGLTWNSWCGPDDGINNSCNTSTYFTNPAGAEMIDDTQRDGNGDQYYQYKVTLSTTDWLNTPSLANVSIEYEEIIQASVVTDMVSNIAISSAQGNGNLTSIGGQDPQRFIQWGTMSGNYTNSCNAGIGDVGDYSCNLTSLSPNTTYFVRAGATNSAGTSYGAETSFTTLMGTPVVITSTITSITAMIAQGSGNVTNTGGESPQRFIEWGTTSGTYTNECSAGIDSAGTYSCVLTGLTPNTTYYVRARATNSEGTGYGSETSFTTTSSPVESPWQAKFRGTAKTRGDIRMK